MNRDWGPYVPLAAVGAVIVVLVIFGWAFSDPANPTFGCAEHEVGVWVDYDDRDMTCVPATDHAAHEEH